MKQFWLMLGSQRNWEVAFENNGIWGLKDSEHAHCMWNALSEGDGLLFYANMPVGGIIGFGSAVTKFSQTTPLWPDEVRRGQVIWPLRFEFGVEYCLPPDSWKSRRYASPGLQVIISGRTFLCYPAGAVNDARIGLGLQPLTEPLAFSRPEPAAPTEPVTTTHNAIKAYLVEIGRMQGYIAEEEYSLDGSYLDVVWRRVQRSVPTFAFEVQLGGRHLPRAIKAQARIRPLE